MALIYVAGPLDTGPPELRAARIAEAIRVGAELIAAGHAPYVPHLSEAMAEAHDISYEEWMSVDLAWLRVAAAVIRIPGDSAGADRETELAESLGIPVYQGLESLVEEATEVDDQTDVDALELVVGFVEEVLPQICDRSRGTLIDAVMRVRRIKIRIASSLTKYL